MFLEGASFQGKTFDCFANFTGAEFQGKVDFSGAVFLKGASFKGVKFYGKGEDVLFEDAIFLPTENDISFSKAPFGKPYHLELDGWRISFQFEIGDYEEKTYNLIRIKQEKEKPSVTETLRDLKEE